MDGKIYGARGCCSAAGAAGRDYNGKRARRRARSIDCFVIASASSNRDQGKTGKTCGETPSDFFVALYACGGQAKEAEPKQHEIESRRDRD
jgi:hypothetical protein